nr:GNAT family N-acetyltransferase [Bacillus safensis]
MDFWRFSSRAACGAVTLIQETLQKLKHRANLTAMYVTLSARGEGAGQALMTKALSFAREREDIEQMYLSVVTTNHSAKRLYRSAGFESYAVEEKALKWTDTYADEEKMVLFLS